MTANNLARDREQQSNVGIQMIEWRTKKEEKKQRRIKKRKANTIRKKREDDGEEYMQWSHYFVTITFISCFEVTWFQKKSPVRSYTVIELIYHSHMVKLDCVGCSVDCCVAEGVDSHCYHLCSYDGLNNSDISDLIQCAPNFKRIVACATGKNIFLLFQFGFRSSFYMSMSISFNTAIFAIFYFMK